jgi:lysophospholipase L1-like esterase
VSRIFAGEVLILLAAAILGLAAIGVLDAPPLPLFVAKLGLVAGAVLTLASWGLRRWLGERRARRLLQQLALMGFSLGLVLVFCEFTVRVLYREITSTADNTSYFARRWTRDLVQINRHGFRERDYDERKAPDVYRIAVIGDSITFGQGIADEDRFSRQLEKELARGPGAYEVLSFGRPGTETVDHLKVLRETVLPAQPDFVLLQWYVNDFHESGEQPVHRLRPLWPHWTHNYLHQYSALYFLLNQRWISLQVALGQSMSEEQQLMEQFRDPQAPRALRYRALAREFIALCRERGIPTAVVLFPHRGENPHESDLYDPLHHLVVETFREEGQQALDLREAFAAYRNDFAALSVNAFDPHPNELANRIAAQRILETLGGFWRARGESRSAAAN